MASAKQKATAKTAVRFRDLKAKKNPRGGTSSGGDRPTESLKFLKLD